MLLRPWGQNREVGHEEQRSQRGCALAELTAGLVGRRWAWACRRQALQLAAVPLHCPAGSVGARLWLWGAPGLPAPPACMQS